MKDSPDSESQAHAVYLVKCRSCQEEDVGETMRAVSIRQIEHCNTIRLGYVSKSAVLFHALFFEVQCSNEWLHDKAGEIGCLTLWC